MEFYSTVQVYQPESDRIAFDTNPVNAQRMLSNGQARIRSNNGGVKVKRLELIRSDHKTDEKVRSLGTPGLIGQKYSFSELIQGGHAWRHKHLPEDSELETDAEIERHTRAVFVRVQLDCMATAQTA